MIDKNITMRRVKIESIESFCYLVEVYAAFQLEKRPTNRANFFSLHFQRTSESFFSEQFFLPMSAKFTLAQNDVDYFSHSEIHNQLI